MDRGKRRRRGHFKHLRRLSCWCNEWVSREVYEPEDLRTLFISGRFGLTPWWTHEKKARRVGHLKDGHFGCPCGMCKEWKHLKRGGKGRFDGRWWKVSEWRRLQGL